MTRSKGYIFVLLAAAGWSFMGLFNRILASDGVDLSTTLVIRNTGSFLLLTILFLIFKRSVFRINLRHLPLFLCSGVISVFGLGVTYFACQRQCSLAVAATLLYLAPAFVVIAAAILWKTPITLRRGMALVLSLAGCALVSGVIGGEITASASGILLGIASGLCYASYTVFAHYALKHYDSYTMIYWTFAVAGCAAMFLFDGQSMAQVASASETVFCALGLVVISTVLPYLLYTRGLMYLESGKAAVASNAEPVLAALIGIFIFAEIPTLWTVLGFLMVLTGVLVLAMERETAEKKEA